MTPFVKSERYYQTCLRDELVRRMEQNPRYSLRSFARALKVDPGAVSRILNGSKLPTPEITKRILLNLGLSPTQQLEFRRSMAQAYLDTGAKRKYPEVKALLGLNGSAMQTNGAGPFGGAAPASRIPQTLTDIQSDVSPSSRRDLAPEVFRVISDWYHYVILQLIDTEGFRSDVRWIARELDISVLDAKMALRRLEELEMIEISAKGVIKRTCKPLQLEDPALTTPALKKRILQINQKSAHSLENDPIETRNHTTATFAIDPAQIPIAKKMIQKFTLELSRVLQTKKRKVYEFQVSLFPVQKSRSKPKRRIHE